MRIINVRAMYTLFKISGMRKLIVFYVKSMILTVGLKHQLFTTNSSINFYMLKSINIHRLILKLINFIKVER